ncbi:MAG: T9SS type A sorting domain-containing protein [Bacteroidetes bacterium]|nr:T9SS type A sorting domain-containing protein [Bacteroidota bacterium]
MKSIKHWIGALQHAAGLTLLSLILLLETASAQIVHRFPAVDTISIVSGCTSPLVVFSVDTSRCFVDSVTVSAGFNTGIYIPDSLGRTAYIGWVYFLVSDSLHVCDFDLMLTNIASHDTEFIPCDTIWQLKTDTFHLVLVVLKNGSRVDSASYTAIVREVPLAVKGRRGQESSLTSLSVYPNPAGNYAFITYHLPVNSQVSVIVYDLLGRRMRKLQDGSQMIGDHAVFWDGKSDYARDVAAGVYLVMVRTKSTRQTAKIIIEK